MPRRYPPGPRDSFGGLSFINRFRKEPLRFISEIGERYGDLAYFRMGPVRAYLANHPDLIRDVLVTKAKSFRKERRALRVLRQVDGNGLVLTEGDFWLRQRRLLQPAFHPRRLEHYSEITVEQTRRHVQGWKTGETLNIADEMTHLTLEIIAKLLFDVELTGKAARLGEAVHVLSEVFFQEASRLIPIPDWIPLPGRRRKRWALETLDTLIWDIIRERRASGKDKGDLLSMLLLAVDEEGDKQGMTDQQARDEAVTMFNAGHDSTAAALAWTWYLIAKHPHVEEKLRSEVLQALGDRPATLADVASLPYTQMAIKESLRLYPPVWTLFVRAAVAEVELGGYSLAPGSWVYLFPWVTQRDARLFPDPERFDPERFAPGRAEQIPQYAWFPFGGGPHVCIGMQLALTEMALIVATTMQHARLTLAANQGPVEPEALLAIRPRGGLRMTVGSP